MSDVRVIAGDRLVRGFPSSSPRRPKMIYGPGTDAAEGAFRVTSSCGTVVVLLLAAALLASVAAGAAPLRAFGRPECYVTMAVPH
jgi:hypothetical protein